MTTTMIQKKAAELPEGEPVTLDLADGTSVNVELHGRGANGVSVEPMEDPQGKGFYQWSSIASMTTHAEQNDERVRAGQPLADQLQSYLRDGHTDIRIALNNGEVADVQLEHIGPVGFAFEPIEGGRWDPEQQTGMFFYSQVASVESHHELGEAEIRAGRPLADQLRAYQQDGHTELRVTLKNLEVADVQLEHIGLVGFGFEPIENGRWDPVRQMGMFFYGQVASIESHDELIEAEVKAGAPLAESLSRLLQLEDQTARIILHSGEVLDVQLFSDSVGPRGVVFEALDYGRWDLNDQIGMLFYSRIERVEPLPQIALPEQAAQLLAGVPDDGDTRIAVTLHDGSVIEAEFHGLGPWGILIEQFDGGRWDLDQNTGIVFGDKISKVELL